MPNSDPAPTAKLSSGDNSLVFRSMAAYEEVSRLFEFQVVALSESADVAAADVLNHDAVVSMDLGEGRQRHFHGLVTAFGIDGVDGRHFRYRLVLRPRLWLATRSSDLRIFQGKSVPDIVKDVLSDHGITLTQRLAGNYPTREYCVQYRETDFNFVSRLLEEEGIFYFHEHSNGGHALVLADDADAYKPMEGFGTVHFREGGTATSEYAGITEWQMRHELQSDATQNVDYNFETPSKKVVGSAGDITLGERYDSPLGAREQARVARYTGAGNDGTIAAGQRVTLESHPRADQNAAYLVLQTRIDLEMTGDESGELDTRFLCRFLLQSAAFPYRPARLTRKPVVAGPQTAVVVGNSPANTILTDKYGRVKVQFHWDRVGKKDDKSSCWLRVASGWAGAAWGMISLPRIGQEVVVGFLEGDPDQPLVVGRVYNAEQMPPYTLPENAHVSTIKSRSVGEKAGTKNFNELRFSDELSKEYVLLHAEKDRLEFVEHDLKQHVMNERHETIDKNRKQHVKGDEDLVVGADRRQTISGDASLKVKKNLSAKVDMKASLESGMDLAAKSGTATSIDAGTELHVKAGLNGAVETGMALHLKGGLQVVVEAGLTLTLKAGGNSIVLGPQGISITGAPMVMINSGGAPGNGNGASPVAPDAPKDASAATLPKDPLA